MTAAALALAALAAFSPLKAEEQNVRAGNEKLVAGDPKAALRHYDEAERKVGAHPEIDYDRGHAAYRSGKLDEAVEHFRKAAEGAPPPLASRALQNAGNALASKGEREKAIGAYREALRRDPSNEDARYDLEVLLRREEKPPPKSGTDPQQQGPAPKPRQGEGKDQGKAPPQPSNQGPEQQGAPEPRPGPQEGQGQGEQRQAGAEERAGERPGQLSRQEAERLLDALRARERKLPTDARQGRAGRTDVDRDW